MIYKSTDEPVEGGTVLPASETSRNKLAPHAKTGDDLSADGDGPVTELERLKQQLQQSRAAERELAARLAAAEEEARRYKTLIDHAPDAVSRFGPDLRYRYHHLAAGSVSRLAPEEFLGKTLAEAGAHEQIAPLLEESFRRVFAAGVEETLELLNPETGRYWEVRVIPELGENGQVETVLAVSRNFTERRQYQEHLEHLARVLDSAHDAIVGLDVEQRVTTWNRAAEELYGWTDEEALGRPAAPLLTGEQGAGGLIPAEESAALWRAIAEKGYYRLKAIHRDKTGRAIHVDSNVVPLHDDEGQFIGYVAAIRDVTARVEAEAERKRLIEAIATEHARLSAVLQALPVGVWFVDLGGSVVLSNQAAREIAGVAAREDETEAGQGMGGAVPATGNVAGTDAAVKPKARTAGAGAADSRAEDAGTEDAGVRGSKLPGSARPGAAGRGPVPTQPPLPRREGAGPTPMPEGEPALPAVVELLWAESGLPVEPGDLPTARALASRRRVEGVELLVRRADGSTIPILASAVPLVDAAGEPVGAVGMAVDISAGKQAREDLRISEERFRLAARAVNGVVYDWDIRAGNTYRSEGMEEVIGLRAEDSPAYRDWWKERIHPDDLPAVKEADRLLFSDSGESYEREYRVRHEDGHWVNISDRAYVIRDASGLPVRVVGVRTDVTARRRAEANARFLAQLGEELLALKDPAAIANYAVGAVAAHLEAERCILDEVDLEQGAISILAERHVPPPSLTGSFPISGWQREMERRMARGQTLVITDTATDPNTAALYEASFAPIGLRSFAAVPRLIDGRWRGTLTVGVAHPRAWLGDELALLKQASNLTWLALENARLLRSLEESRQRFELALRNSGITIYNTDLERRYTWIYNPPLGLRAQDMIGRMDEELFDAEDFKEAIQLKKSVLAAGRGSRKEIQVIMGGRKHYFDVTMEPLRDEAGQLTGLTVAAQDTTRRHKMEEQVRESAANLAIQRHILQQREEERQQIARDLHDGPIQNAISLVFALQTAIVVSQDPEVEEILSRLRVELQKLVVELRDVTNELRPPALGHFGLAKAILAHVEGFSERHSELKINLTLDDDGASIPHPVRLALYRIYQESLNNVIRHAQATQVNVRLFLDAEQITLEVEDNGQGFKVTEEWVNLAQSGRLGLVGMKERAGAVGGRLILRSKPGKGTLVVVRVPRDYKHT